MLLKKATHAQNLGFEIKLVYVFSQKSGKNPLSHLEKDKTFLS